MIVGCISRQNIFIYLLKLSIIISCLVYQYNGSRRVTIEATHSLFIG